MIFEAFSRVISILIIFGASGTVAKVTLSPPWIRNMVQVDQEYKVDCESNGQKQWIGPRGLIQHKAASVRVVGKKSDSILTLVFEPVEKQHTGFYNCVVTEDERVHSQAFHLLVIKPAVFLESKLEVSVVENENAFLECLVDGEPQPEITWHFNEKTLQDSAAPMAGPYTISGSVGLIVNNATWRDSGIYTCRVFQGILQTRNSEKRVRLRVKHSPMPGHGYERYNVVYAVRDEWTNVTCAVLAEPAAYFVWYRHGQPIDPRKYNANIFNEENASVLQISSSQEDAFGEYECESANQLGFLNMTFRVVETVRPDVPAVVISEVVDKKVKLAVSSSASVTAYRVQYTEYTYCSYYEKWRRADKLDFGKDLRRNKTHLTIADLYPNTKYVLRVASYNEGGFSEYSPEVLFRTRKLSAAAAPFLRSDSYVLAFAIHFVLIRTLDAIGNF